MAKQQDFKFIKGELCEGKPADIYFYTDVDYWSVDNFLYEFDYLLNYIKPSKIRIHINSVGGSVVDGMSVFAKIIDCQIPTECINDALAASMGSIIWAAGDELYMKDYALLMIHNPFNESGKKYDNVTEAFSKQLKTIYMKRFGLSESEVDDIMNGKEGEDGTFLTSAQAIEKGFISESHIIETPKAVKAQIQAALKNSSDISQMKAVYGLITENISHKTIKAQNINSNFKKMEENKITVFAALFGLTGEKATAENITAKINELKEVSNKAAMSLKELDDVKAELTKVKAELTGANTSVKNLTEDLKKTKDALKEYQDAEEKAKNEKVLALIDKAITDCKINKEERETYIKMAQNDFELAENVLSKIPARDNLGNIIAQENMGETKDKMTTEEQKIEAKVDEIVGKDFKFRTL